MTKKNQFKGELRRPISLKKMPPTPTLLTNDVEAERKMREVAGENAVSAAAQSLKKMPLLLEHYGIPSDSENCWFWLAHKLALEFVPGFQYGNRKSSGAPFLWNAIVYVALFYSVKGVIDAKSTPARKYNISNACNYLSKSQEPWKGMSARTLNNEYSKAAKPSLVRFLENMYQKLGAFDELDNLKEELIQDGLKRVAALNTKVSR